MMMMIMMAFLIFTTVMMMVTAYLVFYFDDFVLFYMGHLDMEESKQSLDTDGDGVPDELDDDDDNDGILGMVLLFFSFSNLSLFCFNRYSGQ